MPILADGVVLYAGEKVAAVAAETEEAAEDALNMILVDYEDLPVITDPLQCGAAGCGPASSRRRNLWGLLHKMETPSNVLSISRGRKATSKKDFATPSYHRKICLGCGG